MASGGTQWPLGSGPMMDLLNFTGGATAICVRLPKERPAFRPVTRKAFLEAFANIYGNATDTIRARMLGQ